MTVRWTKEVREGGRKDTTFTLNTHFLEPLIRGALIQIYFYSEDVPLLNAHRYL